MKNLLSVGILAGFAMLFAQITAQAATYAFSFVGIDDPNILGSGDLFTSGSSPYAVTGATGSITDRYIPGGSFAITGLSLYAGADNLLYLPASTGFWDNSFGGISFATATGGDFNLGRRGHVRARVQRAERIDIQPGWLSRAATGLVQYRSFGSRGARIVDLGDARPRLRRPRLRGTQPLQEKPAGSYGGISRNRPGLGVRLRR